MPDISVITTVKNGSKYISETIESILNQTYDDFEYIIIDNSSADNTIEIIEKYCVSDNRIKLICLSDDIGPHAAANVGIVNSNGYYIARCDADDVSVPDRFQKQMNFLDTTDARACTSFGKFIDNNSLETGASINHPTKQSIFKWFLCLRCPLIHSSLFVEKEALIEVGGYRNHSFSGDYQLFIDLSTQNWLGTLPEELLKFRLHNERKSIEFEKEQKLATNEIILKHLNEISSDKWCLKETSILYKVGLYEESNISKGLMVLNKWRNSWIDHTTGDEGATLNQIFQETKKRFLKKNARKQPFGFLSNIHYYW